MSVSIVAKGLDDIQDYLASVPDFAAEAASMAINKVARDEEVALRRETVKQVNLQKFYVKNKISIAQKANRNLLRAVIRGTDRPTSLARFVVGNKQVSRGRNQSAGLRVKVSNKSGGSTLKRAFLIELKNGNLGLAIRLPAGQVPDAAYRPKQLTRNKGQPQDVWLLYGPSVDQVVTGIAGERAPQVADKLRAEFFRQFDRVSRRG